MKTLKYSLLSLLFVTQLWAQDSIPSRTWTSLKGKTVEAIAHGIDGDKVILQNASGKTVKFPIHMLTKADQRTIRDHFEGKKADDPKEDDKEKNKGPRTLGKENPKQKDVNGSTIDLPYRLGETITDVEVSRNLKANFYVPSTLRAGEKYPVLIFINPKGGSHGRMSSFIGAAEEHEMIIVTLPKIKLDNRPQGSQAKNWPKGRIYVDEGKMLPYVKDTMRKLHKDFPIDTKRVYTAGFGDSVHFAMWTMKSLDGAGVLAINGGGKGTFNASSRQSFIGMCGTTSKFRWDVASTYKNSKGSSISKMLFYSGKGFPGTSEVEDAMRYLNGTFMLKHQKGTHELASERYEKALMEHLEGVSGDSEFATPWFDFVDGLGLQDKKNKEKVEKWRKELMKDANYVKALKGYDDTVKIALRYFSDGYLGHKNDNGKKSVKSSIKKVAKKYEGTIWESYLNDLSAPAN